MRLCVKPIIKTFVFPQKSKAHSQLYPDLVVDKALDLLEKAGHQPHKLECSVQQPSARQAIPPFDNNLSLVNCSEEISSAIGAKSQQVETQPALVSLVTPPPG